MNSIGLKLAPMKDNAAAPVRCPCCAEEVSTSIYRVPAIPVHSCILLDSAEEARAFPVRDLELAYCRACGFVFNRVFDEFVMRYSTNFEESQHFSETFGSFAKQLAGQMAEKCSIAAKHVIDIGCGKGEFLRELCTLGGATGLGIDPGYREDEGRGTDDPRLQFIVDYFGPKYEELIADVVLCRHTLEHIAPVREFARSIRRLVGTRSHTWVAFETPDANRVLKEAAFGTSTTSIVPTSPPAAMRASSGRRALRSPSSSLSMAVSTSSSMQSQQAAERSPHCLKRMISPNWSI